MKLSPPELSDMHLPFLAVTGKPKTEIASDFTMTFEFYGDDDDADDDDDDADDDQSAAPTTPTTPTVSLVSSDGIYTATAGTGHEANLTLSAAPSYVFWYVQEPGESDFGSTETQDSSGNLTSQLSYSFPSGVSGDYTFRASGTISSTGEGFDVSYTVSVSLPPVTAPSPPVFSLSAGSNYIDVSWSYPDDGGSPITAYYYKYGRMWNSFPWQSAGTSLSVRISGLRANTKYRVKMKSVSGSVSAGGERVGPESNYQTIRTTE